MSKSAKTLPVTDTPERLLYELVVDSTKSHGPESGLCTYCGAIVESAAAEDIEPHSPDCPWRRARSLLGMDLSRPQAIRREPVLHFRGAA